jgi:cytochrome c
MKTISLVLAVTGALVVGSVGAQDVLKDKGCATCHDVAQKKVGPSQKDIAAKYKDDKAAEDKLVAKLKEAKGHPKVSASDAELKAAVKQILATK